MSSCLPRTSPWFALLLAAFCGCDSSEPVAEPTPPDPLAPLTAIVVDDPGLAAALEREWTAREERPLSVVRQSAEALLAGDKPSADLVIYPPRLVGELMEREWIVRLPSRLSRDARYREADLLTPVRRSDAIWGRDPVAAPLAAEPLALLYRRDVLEQIQLPPPRTWTEYQAVIGRIQARSADWRGLPAVEAEQFLPTVEPAEEDWAAFLLLARLAPLLRTERQLAVWFDVQDMTPRLDTPAGRRAMQELRAAAGEHSDRWLDANPDSAAGAVLSGRAAMAVTTPSSIRVPSDSPLVGRLGLAPLPSAEQSFDLNGQNWLARDNADETIPLWGVSGRVASIFRGGDRRAAAEFLAVLADEEFLRSVAAASTAAGPVRRDDLGRIEAYLPAADAQLIDDYRAAAASWNAGRGAAIPRIPRATDYLSQLSASVRQMLRGEATPAEAAGSTARSWEAITERAGRPRQRAAYQRSLGIRE